MLSYSQRTESSRVTTLLVRLLKRRGASKADDEEENLCRHSDEVGSRIRASYFTLLLLLLFLAAYSSEMKMFHISMEIHDCSKHKGSAQSMVLRRGSLAKGAGSIPASPITLVLRFYSPVHIRHKSRGISPQYSCQSHFLQGPLSFLSPSPTTSSQISHLSNTSLRFPTHLSAY